MAGSGHRTAVLALVLAGGAAVAFLVVRAIGDGDRAGSASTRAVAAEPGAATDTVLAAAETPAPAAPPREALAAAAGAPTPPPDPDSGEEDVQPAVDRQLWLDAEELSRRVFEGTAEAEDCVDLALRFLEGAEAGPPAWDQDGSVRFDLGEDPELGTAALHVHPANEGKAGEFVLELGLETAPGYAGPLDAVTENRFALTFGLAEDGLHANAMAHSQAPPSPSLQEYFVDHENLRLGGIADFGPGSASWRPIELSYHVEPDGRPAFTNRFGDLQDRVPGPVSAGRTERVGTLLTAYRDKWP